MQVMAQNHSGEYLSKSWYISRGKSCSQTRKSCFQEGKSCIREGQSWLPERKSCIQEGSSCFQKGKSCNRDQGPDGRAERMAGGRAVRPKTLIFLKQNTVFYTTANAAALRREGQLGPSGRPTQQEPFARRSREKSLVGIYGGAILKK